MDSKNIDGKSSGQKTMPILSFLEFALFSFVFAYNFFLNFFKTQISKKNSLFLNPIMKLVRKFFGKSYKHFLHILIAYNGTLANILQKVQTYFLQKSTI
jgi:hypothetical protein